MGSSPLDLPGAYFKDADEVYAYIGKLFEELAEDEELAPKFQKANTIVQYQYRHPESQITVKLIEGEDGQVDCGATTLEPEVVMTMEADTAHRFWLGKVNVTVALARGQMKAKGPVAKILKLGAAREAGVPALPRAARAGRARGPARGRLMEAGPRWTRPQGVQGLLPVRRPTRVIAGRDLLESTGFEFRRRARGASSSSPTG